MANFQEQLGHCPQCPLLLQQQTGCEEKDKFCCCFRQCSLPASPSASSSQSPRHGGIIPKNRHQLSNLIPNSSSIYSKDTHLRSQSVEWAHWQRDGDIYNSASKYQLNINQDEKQTKKVGAVFPVPSTARSPDIKRKDVWCQLCRTDILLGISLLVVLCVLVPYYVARLNRLERQIGEQQIQLEAALLQLQTKDKQQVEPGTAGKRQSNRLIEAKETYNNTSRGKRDTFPSGLLALHLVHRTPRFYSSNMGTVTDWTVQASHISNNHQLLHLHDYELVDFHSSIKVAKQGLYLVYAQLYFEARPNAHSEFTIGILSHGSYEPRIVASCAIVSPGGPGPTYDQSCYTSAVTSMSSGDKVYVAIQEVARSIDARIGKSFFGIVRLA